MEPPHAASSKSRTGIKTYLAMTLTAFLTACASEGFSSSPAVLPSSSAVNNSMACIIALRVGIYQGGMASWDANPRNAAYVSEAERRGFTPETCASLVTGDSPQAATASSTSPRTVIDVPLRPERSGSPAGASAIMMQRQVGIFVIPVTINNAITLGFILDSGASDVSIPADVVKTLIRTGTIQGTDFLGSKHYRLADGSVVPNATFRIRTLKVGERQIENIEGSVASVDSPLLLGQSFLGRFKSWSVDNQRHMLILN